MARLIPAFLGIAILVGLAPAIVMAQEGAKAIFYSGEGPTVRADRPQPGPGKEAPSTQAESPRKSTTGSTSSQTAASAPLKRQPYIGLSYWIDLVDKDSQRQRVTADRTFRGGDRIRLRVTSNRDGYLYLVNIGSTGRSTMLFPQIGSSFIKANTTYDIPYSATIRFDENRGVETLLLMLSTKPLEPASAGKGQAAPLTAEEAQKLTQVAQQKGAKDLVLESDSAGSQPASYVAAPVALLEGGQTITVEIKLRHE